jgi:hypothetical protein
MSNREALITLAVVNGWTVEDLPSHHERTDSFVRGDSKIQVRYSSVGGIVVAGRRANPADRYLTEIAGAGKAAQVRKLLEEN